MQPLISLAPAAVIPALLGAPAAPANPQALMTDRLVEALLENSAGRYSRLEQRRQESAAARARLELDSQALQAQRAEYVRARQAERSLQPDYTDPETMRQQVELLQRSL